MSCWRIVTGDEVGGRTCSRTFLPYSLELTRVHKSRWWELVVKRKRELRFSSTLIVVCWEIYTRLDPVASLLLFCFAFPFVVVFVCFFFFFSLKTFILCFIILSVLFILRILHVFCVVFIDKEVTHVIRIPQRRQSLKDSMPR